MPPDFPVHNPLDADPVNMAHMSGIPGFRQNSPYPAGYTTQAQAPVDPYSNPRSQGTIPDLMTLLKEEYARYLSFVIAQRQRAGQPTIDLEEAMTKAPFHSFFVFCTRYLNKHRPVQQFAADANVGFMLSNNVRATLCPPVQGGYVGYGGQMQDAGDVGVTHGLSQPGMEGVVDGGGISII